MRDYANPTLLLIVVGMFAWGVSGTTGNGDAIAISTMGLCITAFMVNGALALARALTRRPSLMCVVWSVAYLILSGCAWVMWNSPDDDIYAEDKEALTTQLKSWKESGLSPFASPQEEQECLMVLAAGLGKNRLLRELLALQDSAKQEVINRAAAAATENGRKKSLQLLLDAGVNPDTKEEKGSLISLAAINSRRDIAALLLERKANPNLPDAEGIPPIMHAVINEDLPMVKLLISYGAQPSAQAPDGRDAFSCSRSEEMDAALNGEP